VTNLFTLATLLLAEQGYAQADADPATWTKGSKTFRLKQDSESTTVTQLVQRGPGLAEKLVAPYKLRQDQDLQALSSAL
jgi:hypothetical protein